MYGHAVAQAGLSSLSRVDDNHQHDHPLVDAKTDEPTALQGTVLIDVLIKKQISEAVQFLRQYEPHLKICQFAANQGHANAKKMLELFYQRAQFGSNQGDATAQCYLCICYQGRIGVEKDLKKAVELFTLAAEQRLVSAQRSWRLL